MSNPHPESFGSFEATYWPLVEQAGHEQTIFRQAALTDLLQRYQPALRAHLVFNQKLDRHTADDVLQGFISQKILERNLVRRADPARGKFRSLLVKSLDNFLRDEWKSEAHVLGKAADFNAENEPATPVTSTDAFDVEWARQVLTQVLNRMKADCEAAGRQQVWEIFWGRIWLAAVADREVESYDSLVSRLGLDSPKQAHDLLTNAKRQFRRTLETVIEEYVTGPAAIRLEVEDLQRILSTGRNILPNLQHYDRPDSSPAYQSFDPDCSIEASLSLQVQFPSAEEDSPLWRNQDLAGLLRHQLSLPVACLTSLMSGPAAASSLTHNSRQIRLLELFQSHQPEIDVLIHVKDVCKSIPDSNATLPKELLTILYHAAIATAHLRRGQWISSSPPRNVAKSLVRMMAAPWCDPELRRLFAETHLTLGAT